MVEYQPPSGEFAKLSDDMLSEAGEHRADMDGSDYLRLEKGSEYIEYSDLHSEYSMLDEAAIAENKIVVIG